MVQTRRAGVEDDRLSDVVGRLVVTSHVEACLRIVRVVGDAGSVLDVADTAEQSHATSKVLSLSVEVEGVLSHVLSFKILGPPLVESGVLLALDE